MWPFLVLATLIAPPTDDPPVGLIEIYGLRHVDEALVRTALGLKVGDPIPESDTEIRARLERVTGVAEARLEGVCCDAGKAILFIGIREIGEPGLTFRPAPQGNSRLPDDIIQAGAAFDEAFMAAVVRGDAEDDSSQGHSLMKDPATRAIQERFPAFAARDLPLLRTVLQDSSDVSQRALAAQVIAYAADKGTVIDDLASAMRDPSSLVRNNAMRGLALIAAFAQRNPALHLSVPSAPFVGLLNSIDWTDRNKASAALLALTESRDAALLADLRRRALDSLIEMARWRSRGHAYAPFFVLGRVAGMSEGAIAAAWERNDPETVVKAARVR